MFTVYAPISYLHYNLSYSETVNFNEKSGYVKENASTSFSGDKFVLQYPGVQIDLLSKDNSILSFDMSFLEFGFNTPKYHGNYHSSYCLYGPNYTCTGTVTYDSTYSLQTKIEAQYLSRSFGVGARIPVKKNHFILTINSSKLKRLYLSSNTLYESGKESFFVVNYKLFNIKQFFYDRFFSLKLQYMKDLNTRFKLTTGFVFSKKVTESPPFDSKGSYFYTQSRTFDLKKLNILTFLIGITFS